MVVYQNSKDPKPIAAYAERAIGTTNNRMEMSAILWALRNYGGKEGDFFVPLVYSDSMYCINSFTTWLNGWKAQGWTRANGKPLENKDLIIEYDRLVNQEGLKIELRYVKGHNGDRGNELADKLATGAISVEEVLS